MTFASSYLKRDVDVKSDYSDYSFFYDTLYGSALRHFTDNAGDLINPSQYIKGKDRLHQDGATNCASRRRRKTAGAFVGGLFAQRQTHDIEQAYKITGLADAAK